MGTSTPGARSWPLLIDQLVSRVDLREDDTAWAMAQIMSGEATSAQIAGFVIALRSKGETPREISGLADAMLAHALRIDLDRAAVDVVGTGGDHSNSVNISTMAALVAAAAGATVAKAGNRSASSSSGAADVLEALGVVIDLPPPAVERCIAELGIGFCFAPVFHPALRHAGPARRELGVPTTFNLLGPLANPAQPPIALVGCAFEDKAPLLAEVFARRGATVLVVHGDDGLDELTTTTTSRVWIVSGGEVEEQHFDPVSVGIARARVEDLRGGTPRANAEVVRGLVAGKAGPVRDAVLLNAAAALAAFAGFSGSLEQDIAAGLTRAAEAVDSGAAEDLLERWVEFSASAR